jgi:hypothetical protein
MIYHGTFGTGFFQTLYNSPPALSPMLVTSLEYHVLVTLPLLVLGVIFRMLLPLGITSMLVSVAVCAGAAAQADIPKNKRRFWSRPLVALLFFLQPIVRGWARYRGRLNAPPSPMADPELLESLRLEKRRPSEQIDFASDLRVSRIQFLTAIMNELDRKHWPNKADAGWNRFDLEIYGNRWCNLRLITASEMIGSGRQIVRCRLQTTWTLFAKVLFWSGMGVELLILGFFGPAIPWLWCLLATLPLFVWWIHKNKRDLQRVMGVFLDKVAGDLNLVSIPSACSAPGPSLGAESPPRVSAPDDPPGITGNPVVRKS